MRIVPNGTAQRVEARQHIAQVPSSDEIDSMTLPELREVVKSVVEAQRALLEIIEAKGR
jgi:hypothetical protein